MEVRTEDYRPYGKNYHGRAYRIYRVYTNNLNSILTNKWTIIVMALSFVFLFFSVLAIVFAGSATDFQEEQFLTVGPEVYFDIVPDDIDDLQVETFLNSTFEVSYNVTNVGSEETDPYVFILPPNSEWDISWDAEKETLFPGESMNVDVIVHVPDNMWSFQRFDSDPISNDNELDGGREPDKPSSGDGSGFSSPEQLYIGSYMLDNMFSRLMLMFTVPGDVDLFSAIETGTLEFDPRISSIGTVISLEKEEPELLKNRTSQTIDMNFSSTFEMSIEETEDDPYRMEVTSHGSRDLRVIVNNTGNRTIRVKLEAYQMEVNDWDWSVEIYPILDHENNPEGDIEPGGEMAYDVRIFSGFLTKKIPYNIMLIGTETTTWEYKESRAKLVIVDIKGQPEEKELEEDLFDTFWGNEFHYERFLWLVLLTAVAGSGLISNDLKNNTFTLYLSRPLTWLDYALGKYFALATTLSLITLVPVFLIFITKMAFTDESFSYVAGNLWILGGMILSYLFVVMIFSSIALALSSLTKRGIIAGVGIFAYFVLTPPVSDIMESLFENDYLKLFNINLVLKNLVLPFYGLKYNADAIGFGYHLVLLESVLLFVISWAILFFRFHNKEVAK